MTDARYSGLVTLELEASLEPTSNCDPDDLALHPGFQPVQKLATIRHSSRDIWRVPVNGNRAATPHVFFKHQTPTRPEG